MSFLCLYSVKLNFNGENNIEHGVIPCASYTDAMSQLEDYYGSELMDIKLELYDASVFLFNDEYLPTIKQILKNLC